MRRLITLAVGLLCLASGYAVAQNEVDPTEVERFTDGDAEQGAPAVQALLRAAATARTAAAAPRPSCRTSPI